MKLAQEVKELCESIPRKVKVPSYKKMKEAYRDRVDGKLPELHGRGALKDIIIVNLYTQALLKEKTCLLSKLAKEFSIEKVWYHYQDVIADIEHYFDGADIYND